jgi:hypothetical protein
MSYKVESLSSLLRLWQTILNRISIQNKSFFSLQSKGGTITTTSFENIIQNKTLTRMIVMITIEAKKNHKFNY